MNNFDSDNFFGPINYSFVVLVVGLVGLLLCIIVITYFVFDILVKIRSDIKLRRSAKRETLETRRKFLSVIDNIEELYQNKTLSIDGVFYEISRALRNYATSKTGENITSLTLEEFNSKENLSLLKQQIYKLYFPEFSKRKENVSSMSPEEAIDSARTLIGGW